MEYFFQGQDLLYFLEISLRLVFACVLGGVIGYEREGMNRPAGFRTHILVSVGAALVMIISDLIFRQYKGLTTVDPARLGAQVISGIGFLCAGTIIREGVTVKGLTTAASLWTVACVGLAVGIGYYVPAIVATMLIVLTLVFFKKLEDSITRKRRHGVIYVHTTDVPLFVKSIGDVFSNRNISVKNMDFNEEDDALTEVKMVIKMPFKLKKEDLVSSINKIEGVKGTEMK